MNEPTNGQTPEELERRRRHRNRLLFLIFAGAMGIVLLVIGGYQLIEFTDSTAFCGRLCHDVMYPEYTAYQASPHSRVACSECHVGPGADYLVKSKVSGVPLIFATLSGHYDRPIPTPVENLRPARDRVMTSMTLRTASSCPLTPSSSMNQRGAELSFSISSVPQ